MRYLFIRFILLGIYEIRPLIKQKLIKEIIVYSVLALLILGTGYLYFSDPYQISLAKYLLNLIGQDI